VILVTLALEDPSGGIVIPICQSCAASANDAALMRMGAEAVLSDAAPVHLAEGGRA
jgi:hypothetical protein